MEGRWSALRIGIVLNGEGPRDGPEFPFPYLTKLSGCQLAFFFRPAAL